MNQEILDELMALPHHRKNDLIDSLKTKIVSHIEAITSLKATHMARRDDFREQLEELDAQYTENYGAIHSYRSSATIYFQELQHWSYGQSAPELHPTTVSLALPNNLEQRVEENPALEIKEYQPLPRECKHLPNPLDFKHTSPFSTVLDIVSETHCNATLKELLEAESTLENLFLHCRTAVQTNEQSSATMYNELVTQQEIRAHTQTLPDVKEFVMECIGQALTPENQQQFNSQNYETFLEDLIANFENDPNAMEQRQDYELEKAYEQRFESVLER